MHGLVRKRAALWLLCCWAGLCRRRCVREMACVGRAALGMEARSGSEAAGARELAACAAAWAGDGGGLESGAAGGADRAEGAARARLVRLERERAVLLAWARQQVRLGGDRTEALLGIGWERLGPGGGRSQAARRRRGAACLV
jgi:hypothetical protein